MAGLHEVARAAGLKDPEVAAVFEQILARCHNGERVTIKGFGTFKLKKYKGRVVTSPLLEGGKADVPAYTRIKFKPSKLQRVVIKRGDSEIENTGKAKGIVASGKRKGRKPKRKYMGHPGGA